MFAEAVSLPWQRDDRSVSFRPADFNEGWTARSGIVHVRIMEKTPDLGTVLGNLMADAQKGDERAYIDLLGRISGVIRATVRRRERRLQPADIEDAVQDILISVHQVRATYDPARPFLPWLFSIVHNRLIDRFRRYSRAAAHEILVDHLSEDLLTQHAGRPETTFGDEELLMRALETLPPSQRRAIELLKLKELSLKEASEETGLSVANLKVLVHRAVKTLRNRMSAGDGH